MLLKFVHSYRACKSKATVSSFRSSWNLSGTFTCTNELSNFSSLKSCFIWSELIHVFKLVRIKHHSCFIDLFLDKTELGFDLILLELLFKIWVSIVKFSVLFEFRRHLSALFLFLLFLATLHIVEVGFFKFERGLLGGAFQGRELLFATFLHGSNTFYRGDDVWFVAEEILVGFVVDNVVFN